MIKMLCFLFIIKYDASDLAFLSFQLSLMSEVLAWLKQKVDIIDKQTEHKDLEKVVRKIILWLLRYVRVSSS